RAVAGDAERRGGVGADAGRPGRAAAAAGQGVAEAPGAAVVPHSVWLRARLGGTAGARAYRGAAVRRRGHRGRGRSETGAGGPAAAVSVGGVSRGELAGVAARLVDPHADWQSFHVRYVQV